MAGDWIKMRHDLHDDPAVIGMSAELEASTFEIVGKLHKVWSWADRHLPCGLCDDGIVTEKFINDMVVCETFTKAMKKVGWLQVSKRKIVFPNFNRHNSKSAKNRALHSSYVKQSRDDRKVTKPSPEKSRVEKSNKPPLSPHGGDVNVRSLLIELFFEGQEPRAGNDRTLNRQLPKMCELSRSADEIRQRYGRWREVFNVQITLAAFVRRWHELKPEPENKLLKAVMTR